ncbi:MAG: hypothetical protein GY940_40140, partial [bacterium]|nr:hypothetical protein [bacterium]
LPAHMIPSSFVPVDTIPLTPNGKIDRQALPEPGTTAGEDFIPPRNPVEKKLVEIWAEVLGLEKETIGIDGDFFHMGGHSLKGTALTAKIHKELHVKLPLAELFRNPHIRGLARYIENAGPDTYIPLEPGEAMEYYPVSSAQEQFYVLQQVERDSIGYNITVVLEGEYDRERLEQAFKAVIRRHESLRTSFEIIEGELVQRIHHANDAPFEIPLFYSPAPSPEPGNPVEDRTLKAVIE